jgi:Xaa-Pro aminopeptidase
MSQVPKEETRVSESDTIKNVENVDTVDKNTEGEESSVDTPDTGSEAEHAGETDNDEAPDQSVDPFEGMDLLSHTDHATWRFDFNPVQNMFRTDNLDDIDHGVFVQYDGTKKVEDEKGYLSEQALSDFRKAALIHKLVRKQALDYLYPGGKLADLVDAVESLTLRLTKQDPKTYYIKGSPKDNDAGIAFPVGVNINNVVAHDSKTVAIKDDRRFVLGDVVKVDIGVHINGRIIDSAFTHIISEKKGVSDPDSLYNTVLEASRDSVFSTIKMAGPDQSLYELS